MKIICPSVNDQQKLDEKSHEIAIYKKHTLKSNLKGNQAN